jgi:hypothetical protein
MTIDGAFVSCNSVLERIASISIPYKSHVVMWTALDRAAHKGNYRIIMIAEICDR